MFSGESLHRRSKYEPNILQKLRFSACTKKRVAILATVTSLLILTIVVIAIVNSHSAGNCGIENMNASTNKTDSTEKPSKQTYISTNGKPFPYHEIRLPEATVPVHYHIFLNTDIAGSSFNGQVTIWCNVREDTDFIVLHVKDLIIESVSVQQNDTNNDLTVSEYLIYKENEQLLVRMESPVTKGTIVKLVIGFNGQLIAQLSGFYRSMYKTSDGQER